MDGVLQFLSRWLISLLRSKFHKKFTDKIKIGASLGLFPFHFKRRKAKV